MSKGTTAYAQIGQNQCPRGQEMARREEILRNRGWNGQLDRNGNVDLNRNGVDDRCETALWQGGNFRDDRFGNRSYRNDTYNNYPYNRGSYNNNRYDNYGNNSEFQQGYRDGLMRGREDALSYRAMNPNNSMHYRNGDRAYRAGFERGFYEAYRQNSRRPWN